MAKKVTKRAIGSSSCNLSIKPQSPNFKEAICEVCDRVFKTNNDDYICPKCKEKAKNSR